MGAQLRVVLDQAATVVHPDQAGAAIALARGLVATAPSGCSVEAIVPAGADVDLPGVQEVHRLPLGRRELAASWQLGIAPGVGAGLIHAPSLLAPLVRHDRVHDHHQIVVTVWDLAAWEAPETMSKTAVAWHRAMLKRAAKHADAVVVPAHAMAERIGEFGRFGDRVRVIAGAAPDGFVEPADAAARRAALQLPESYAVLSGPEEALPAGFRAAVAAGLDAVVVDAADGSEPRVAELGSAAGLPERRVHVRGAAGPEDRAAVLAGASVFVDVDGRTAWPWRAVEAMTLGVPVVAVDSGVHRDVVADGGVVVAADELADAVREAVHGDRTRLGVLAADRSRAFSWASSAERVWQLHADI